MLTFFLSACPFFRSLFAMITPVTKGFNAGHYDWQKLVGMGEKRAISGEAEKVLEERDHLSKGEMGLSNRYRVCVFRIRKVSAGNT